MPMNPRLLRPLASGVHPEAAAWRTRVIDNGGSVSAASLRAVSRFCADIDRYQLRDRFIRLSLLCGNSLNAALVPLYRARSRTDTPLGNATDENPGAGPFVSGNYTSESSGLIGNGTSTYLNTGINLSELPDIATGHLSVFKGAGSTISRVLIGARNSDSSHYYRYDLISAQNRGLWGNVVIAQTSADTVRRYAIVSRTPGTSLTMYHDGTSVATSGSSSTPALPGRNLFVFAENDGVPQFYWPHAIYAYSIGLALDATQAANLNTAMQSLATALGR
jgi:hypothetical protein